MGASPDANIVLTGSGNIAHSSTAIAIAFRGVDLTTPEDGVALTTASSTSTNPDCASITPTTTDDVIIAYASTFLVDTTGTAGPSGYSNFTQVSSNDNNDTTSYLAWKGGLTAATPEDPSAFTGVSSAIWRAYSIVLKPAASVAAPSFGWYEQQGKPVFTPNHAIDSAFARGDRPGVNFTTPTPSNLEWYVQFGLPRFTKSRVPSSDFVRAAIDFAVAPPIGWNEQFSKPVFGQRRAPDNSFSLGQFQAPAVTLTTDIGWFVPYAKRPLVGPAPASSVSWTPQPFVAVTLTTDIGWYVPFNQPVFVKSRAPNSAFTRGLFKIPAATPTDFGWYEPFGRPIFTPRRQPDNSFARAPFNFSVAPPIGWLTAFSQRPQVGVKAPMSRVSVFGQPFVVQQTGLGWFEPYSARVWVPIRAPRSTIAWDPKSFAQVARVRVYGFIM